ncbi:MAG: ATP-binding cassette domain-containing protein [Desulfurococcales archaeon]|nr:ATP-binding cassette domain-containing protein [Desulfurococcales archaeon]
MPDNCAVEVMGLTKEYGDLVAVDKVSFCIPEGIVFSLLGPNGAGKTTTIHMLSTLLQPTGGDAYIHGFSIIRDKGEVRKIIGLVPQDLTADDELTGWENVYIQAKLYGLQSGKAEEKTEEALRFMELWDHRKRRVSTYSGGMRRRIEIAMSLVNEPKVMFLDEPTLGLDVHSRRHLWGLIERLKEQGTTILLTTHYMDEAEHLADRVAIIDHGKIIAEDTPDGLKARIKGDRIYLRFKGEEETQALLKELAVKGFDSSLHNGSIIVKVEKSEAVLPKLITLLQGKELLEIRVVKPNLEEVFIELTGRGLRGEEEAFDSFKYRVMRRRMKK